MHTAQDAHSVYLSSVGYHKLKLPKAFRPIKYATAPPPHLRKRGFSFTLCMWLCMKWHEMVYGCMVYTDQHTKIASVSPGNSQTALYVHDFGEYSKCNHQCMDHGTGYVSVWGGVSGLGTVPESTCAAIISPLNNNNVHLSCAHLRPERSHDTC